MKNINLADPHFNERKPIDLILGADVFEEILLDGSFKEEGGLHFRNSIFGWIASGKQPNQNTSSPTTSLCINETFNLKRFWQLEELPKAKQWTDEELACEKHFQETTQIVENRFEVSMPFKPDARPLGDTYVQAKRRFLSLEKRLQSNPSLKQGYTDFINEFITLQHLEIIPEPEIDKPQRQLNFLPHHCVHKEDSTTTKLRVVFDGSAKSTTGISLNNSLMIVPTVQEDIFSILIRFRFHKIALSADIAKMYRQVALDKDGKDYHGILWRDSKTKSIQQYRMTRCTYGIASSAFHCTRAVKEVGDLCADKELGHSIRVDFYVDDYLSGADSITEARTKVTKVCDEFKKYGMQLRKWASSHYEITAGLPEELRENVDTTKVMHEDYKIKTLGISWKPNKDKFCFYTNFTDQQHRLTKRELLSVTAKLFDPIGWLGPIVIRFKILLQRLWVLGIKWDDFLPHEIQEEWNQMKRDLQSLRDFTLQRCVVPQTKIETVQLHLFTDASEQACAAVIYSRITDTDGFVSVNLVAGKNRVAPIKTVSLPRLELCGAHLGVKLLVKIKEILNLTSLPEQEVFGWTDSTIVLQWLAQLPRTWTIFVANRVSEVQQNLPRSNWNHVSSSSNPADSSSRGTTLELLQSSSLRWNGPEWLHEPQDLWPKTKLQQIEPIEIRGQTANNIIQSTSLAVTQLNLIFRHDQYSSFSKLIRVVARVLMAIDKFKRTNRSSDVTVTDLTSAKLKILAEHQLHYYATEHQTLKTGKELSKQSKILNLTPFFDKESMTIRVGGRLAQGQFRELKKFPLLVSQDSKLALLILQHFHEDTLHGGTELTVNSSREEFWIPNAKVLVKKVIRQCVKCSCFQSKIPYQLMADLPAERITPANPFEICGLDLAGPIYTKPGVKTYIAIFVCFVIKAVHIELVTDLTKESCTFAIKRFISRRGLPRKILSDNGKNFIGARNDIIKVQEILALENSKKSIGSFMVQESIEWEMIPPRSPHFGGLWEAAVKSMKRHLRRIVGLQILSFEEHNTQHRIVIQIEGILNSRPLFAMSSDPNDLQPITPAHFLLGKSAKDLPTVHQLDAKMDLGQRFKLLEAIKTSFWKAWYRDYLVTLQVRKRWLQSGPSFQLGDIVLVAEDNLPPLRWLYSGNDDINRVAKLKTVSGHIIRPIVKLRKLPVDASQENPQSENNPNPLQTASSNSS